MFSSATQDSWTIRRERKKVYVDFSLSIIPANHHTKGTTRSAESTQVSDFVTGYINYATGEKEKKKEKKEEEEDNHDSVTGLIFCITVDSAFSWRGWVT